MKSNWATRSAMESSGAFAKLKRVRRLAWWSHTLFLIAAVILYLNLPKFFGITPGPWMDRLALWVGMGYLYWAWDRGLQVGWRPSGMRGVLRSLLVLLLAASPMVIVLAVLNLRDYTRSNLVESGGSVYSSNEGSVFETRANKLDTNPATGLPMTRVGDIDGNPYGTDS